MMGFLLQLQESLKIALQSIFAHKLRSALTTLGIIIGIVSVTLMNMTIEGLGEAFRSSISAIGADVLYIQKWPWFAGEDWWKYRNRREIKISYAKDIKERSTYAVAVAPTVFSRSTLRLGSNSMENVIVIGTTDEFIYTAGVSVEFGRFMSEVEVKAERPVCVIGAEIAEKLFGNVNPIGRDLKIAGRTFRVVGVLEKQGKFLGLESLDDRVYIPIGQFMRMFPWRTGATITVKIKNMDEIEEAIEELLMVYLQVLEQSQLSVFDHLITRSVYDVAYRQVQLVQVPHELTSFLNPQERQHKLRATQHYAKRRLSVED